MICSKKEIKLKKKKKRRGETREGKTNSTERLSKNGWSGPAADAVAAGEDGSGWSCDGAALCLYAAYSGLES